MELGGEDVVLPNCRRESFAVGRARGDDGGVRGFGKETVNEIDIAAGCDAAEKRAIAANDFELVPADLWNFEAAVLRKTNDFALENTQARGATIEFFAPLEESLVTDADAEEWPT